MPKPTDISEILIIGLGIIVFALGRSALAADSISVQLAHHTPREMQTAQTLKQVLSKYDLSKYTFTRAVVIEGAQ